uniref:Uncharacterized protein n=1 Tax=viral metagenome TaxID=1070528 RepID=A0A6H1ZAZ3_9ZZZZ
MKTHLIGRPSTFVVLLSANGKPLRFSMEMLETLRRMQEQSNKSATDDGVLTVDCYVQFQRKRLPVTDIELYSRDVFILNTSCA